MARTFFKKIKKVFLSVSLLTSLLMGVFALPLYTVKADDTYQLGLPNLESYNNRLISTQYPQNIHNYFDMVWYGLYQQIQNYRWSNDLSSITTDQVSQFFTSLSPSTALALSQQGYDPNVLINIYAEFRENIFFLVIQYFPKSLLVDSPTYFSYNNGYFNLYSGYLPMFVQYGNSNSKVLTPLIHQFTGDTLFTSSFVNYSTEYTAFTYSPSTPLTLFLSCDYDFNISKSAVCNPDQHTSLQSYDSFFAYDLSCVVSSFPFYTEGFISHPNKEYQPYLNKVNNTTWNFSLPYTSGIENGSYYFELSNYIVYSTYQFNFYPSPSPYPTVLPTVTPTPMPLGYDTDVSGTNDALGYLSTLGDYFTNILSTWTVIPLLATTLGYVFHYSPWFGIALLVPTIALLSLLIGRNKS